MSVPSRSVQAAAALPSKFHFVTECFFLALRAVYVTLIVDEAEMALDEPTPSPINLRIPSRCGR